MSVTGKMDSEDIEMTLSAGESVPGLERRIAELEAALRPFADFYTPSMELAGDGHVITQGSSMARRQLTVGDVRRAYKSFQR